MHSSYPKCELQPLRLIAEVSPPPSTYLHGWTGCLKKFSPVWPLFKATWVCADQRPLLAHITSKALHRPTDEVVTGPRAYGCIRWRKVIGFGKLAQVRCDWDASMWDLIHLIGEACSTRLERTPPQVHVWKYIKKILASKDYIIK